VLRYVTGQSVSVIHASKATRHNKTPHFDVFEDLVLAALIS